MRVTKFVHSCLLVETDKKAVLVDPGHFSWDSGLVDVNTLPTLNCVVVTHEHQDHFSVDFAKSLQVKEPNLTWIAPPAVMNQLESLGIKSANNVDDEVETFPLTHERGPWKGMKIDNWGVNVYGQLTHPGDSLQLQATLSTLALPITAPWGSMTQAADLALNLKPKTIIPIHDWHYNDQARAWAYDVLKSHFEDEGINFISIRDGQPVEI